MGNATAGKRRLESRRHEVLAGKFLEALRALPRRGYLIGHGVETTMNGGVGKDSNARSRALCITAPSAYRCFLPDLAGLGGGHERSARLRAFEGTPSGERGIRSSSSSS